MAHNESRDSGDDGLEPEPRSGASESRTSGSAADHARSSEIAHQLTDTTAQLVAMLQLRLEALRRNRDVQLSEIAKQLEEQLAQIRKEIGETDRSTPDEDAD